MEKNNEFIEMMQNNDFITIQEKELTDEQVNVIYEFIDKKYINPSNLLNFPEQGQFKCGLTANEYPNNDKNLKVTGAIVYINFTMLEFMNINYCIDHVELYYED